MNVFLLLSGGVGNRFGANIPKQYVLLNNKPIIEYVLKSALNAQMVDKVVVVMDPSFSDITPLLHDDKVSMTLNGKDRYTSLKNGLEFIKNNIDCENVMVADAVAPFITPELIDDYFKKLEEYDMVITGQKITGNLQDYKGTRYDREEFFMGQAPESYKFDMLYNNVDYSTKYQAIPSLMPVEAKRYVNFDFKDNLKLTYPHELEYAEFILKKREEEKELKLK